MPLPTDPSLSLQWHLINTTPGGLDLKVERVWNPSDGPAYTGTGIRIAVTAEAFEYNHPDLVANYLTTPDFDFLGNDPDPFPVFSGLTGNDGTAHLGLIGADNNTVHGVGVAFDSQVFGYGLLAIPSAGFMATWISHLQQALASAAFNADVLSMGATLGNVASMGFNISASLSQIAALRAAVDSAVDTGRDGLGTIITLGAGSAFSGQTDTNGVGQTNNTQQIVVAAVQSSGYATATTAQGSSILVSAFGQGLGTLDRVGANGLSAGDFNASYSDDDAAAALVSGVVGLMLDANEGLGWRDVQTILAYGARHVGTDVGQGFNASAGFNENSAWAFNGALTWNAGGLHYSRDYGFGLVDAHASVRLAETWFQGVGATGAQTSANETAITTDLLSSNVTLDGSSSTLATEITEDIVVERVAVTLDFETTYLSDVDIILRAPDGTEIPLLADQAGSTDFNGVWTVEAQALRGISSLGTWEVVIVDDVGGFSTTFRDVQLTIYGAAQVNDRYVFTDEFSDYGAYNRINTVVDANGGTDVVNASAVTSNSTIFLDGRVSRIDTMRTSFSGVENAIGGDGNDSVTGSAGANAIWGGRGRDTLRGEGGQDSLFGDSGNDSVLGGDGNDFVSGGDGNDTLYGHTGGAGSPAEDNDTLDGGAGNDFMYGTFGDDLFLMGTGNDYADGGAGNNTASYADETSGVLVDLTGALTQIGGALGDTLVGIQNLIGTNFTDTLHGDSVNNQLHGGGGLDMLFGGLGADSLYGGADNDSLYGGADGDVLDGGAGTRDLAHYGLSLAGLTVSLNNPAGNTGDAAGDIFIDIEGVVGSEFDDTLVGNSGANWLYGSLGNDSLNGQTGDDSLYGGTGDDTLIGGAGADYLDGGTGLLDIASYATSTVGVLAFLATPGSNTGDALGDTYIGIEGLRGSNFGDILGGDGGDNLLFGLGGNDELYGGSGNDTLMGGGGNDLLQAGLGDDSLSGENGNDRFLLNPGEGNDSIYGGTGFDLIDYSLSSVGVLIDLTNAFFVSGDIFDSIEGIVGSDFADQLVGGAGNDSLFGGAGDDAMAGREGADHFDGGAGNDTVSYFLSTTAVGVDMLTPSAGVGDGAGDSFADIEVVLGSGLADTIAGTHGGETLWAWEGDDIIIGRGGADSLIGDFGNDTLMGGAGADTLDGGTGTRDRASYADAASGVLADLSNAAANTGDAAGDLYSDIEDLEGSAFADTLYGDGGDNQIFGGDGNDVLQGGDGADLLDGGLGLRDRVQYTDSATGLRVDLQNAAANTGIAAGDTFVGIEDLRGSNRADTLLGTGAGNMLWGANGHDTLNGRAGNDTLDGGAGQDSFVFSTTLGASNIDRINNFNAADDTIRLEDAIFTGLATGTLAATAFAANLTGTATTAAHRVIYETDTGKLYFDADGTGAGARVQFSLLAGAPVISELDFLVI